MLKQFQQGRFEIKEVVTCFLEFGGKILILKRSEKVGTYQGKWAGVSGYVETTPDKQALKEIREETGLRKSDIKLIRKGKPFEILDERLKRKWIIHSYLFHINNPDKIRINWEHTESKWIFPRELSNYSTVPELKETLNKCINRRRHKEIIG
ncbi:NUDIX pyrophosphatase [candidate division WOR-3 bacterium]|nr:NUDIX pyrophosphatase [candidate division WOR-3 bacterium]